MENSAIGYLGFLISILIVGIIGSYIGDQMIAATDLTGGTVTSTTDYEWMRLTEHAGWAGRIAQSSVILPDGSIVVMGGYDGGATLYNDTWRSTDNGETWVEQNASSGWAARWSQATVSPGDGSIVLMGGYDGTSRLNDTWRSTDNGVTWVQQNASSGWMGRVFHTSSALSDGSILVMGGYNDPIVLNDTWRSTDNGATWTEQNASSGWSARFQMTSVPLSDGSVVLLGGIYGVGGGAVVYNDTWRSTDSGVTWVQQNPSSGWAARIYDSCVVLTGDRIVLMGGFSGMALYNDMWESTDKGVTWTEMYPISPWSARVYHTTAALPDDRIVLMGGTPDGMTVYNDVWRYQLYTMTTSSPFSPSQNDIVDTFTLGIILLKILVIVVAATIIFILLQQTGLIPRFGGGEGKEGM